MIHANLLPWRETQKTEQRWQIAWCVFGLCMCLIFENLVFFAYEAYLKRSWETQYASQWQTQQAEYDTLNARLELQSQQSGLYASIRTAEQSVWRLGLFLSLLNRLEDRLPLSISLRQIALFPKDIRISLTMRGENNLAGFLKDIAERGYYQEPIVRLSQQSGKAKQLQHARIDIPLVM